MTARSLIRVAAVLVGLMMGAPSAHGQYYFGPGLGYGFGGWGMPYGGYGYGGYGYGMPYGGYGYGSYSPGYSLYYSPGYTSPGYGYTYYSPPLVISPGPGASSGGAETRSTLAPAVAVPQDSSLLLAAWNAPTHSTRAALVVVVPTAQARIIVEGAQTQLTGKIRRFNTPPLVPNKLYEYTVQAQWTDANGQLRSETRNVQIRAGNVVDVVFPRNRY